VTRYAQGIVTGFLVSHIFPVGAFFNIRWCVCDTFIPTIS